MDIELFASTILGINLYPMQVEALNHRGQFSIISAQRQRGKSTMAMISALYEATMEQKTIMYYLPNSGLRNHAIHRCLDLTSSEDFLSTHGMARIEQSDIVFDNGSVIHFRTPAQNGLVGWRLNDIILDECDPECFNDETLTWAVATNAGSVTKFNTFGDGGRDLNRPLNGVQDMWKTISITPNGVITLTRKITIDENGNLQRGGLMSYEN